MEPYSTTAAFPVNESPNAAIVITPGAVALVLSSVMATVGAVGKPPHAMRVPTWRSGTFGEQAVMARTASPTATGNRR